MRVVFAPEVEEDLYGLIKILVEKEYLGTYPFAFSYVEELIADIQQNIHSKLKKKGMFNDILENGKFPRSKSTELTKIIEDNKDENREVFCKALLKQIGVLADGSLVPCCLDHNGDVILGNLLHQSLEEILSSPRAQAMTEGFKHHTATEALCQNCESALVRNSFRGKARN